MSAGRSGLSAGRSGLSAGAQQALPVGALRRFARPDTRPRCELCADELPEQHRHLLGRDDHVACACGPCHILFAGASGAWQAIPDRVLADPGVTAPALDGLDLPVGLALVTRDADGLVVRYPGPAGLVDGELAPDAARALAAVSPLLGLLEPRVEVLLLHRGAEQVRALLAPVTTAFELVGRLRAVWQGFDGGSAAATEVDAILAELGGRAVAVA